MLKREEKYLDLESGRFETQASEAFNFPPVEINYICKEEYEL